jgi:hypothetical protein
MEDIDTSVLRLRPSLMLSDDAVPVENAEINELALLDKE